MVYVAFVAGAKTFTVKFNTAGTSTVSAKDTAGLGNTLTIFNHSAITVNPGSPVKLLVLVPGETADPGNTASATPGKTGTPTPRMAGVNFSIEVRLTDNTWNLVSGYQPTIHIETIGDLYDDEPDDAQLNADGKKTFNVTLLKAGINQTQIKASDVGLSYSDYTSPAITVITQPV